MDRVEKVISDGELLGCPFCDASLSFLKGCIDSSCSSCGKRVNRVECFIDFLSPGSLGKFQETCQKFYDTNGPKYDEKWQDFEDWQVELRRDFLTQTGVADDESAIFVDLACGPGRDAAFFHAEGAKNVVGIDLSETQLQLARQKLPEGVLIRADMRSLPLRDDSVNALWCCVALIHIQRSELLLTLEGIYRILKPNALAFFSFFHGKGTTEVRREIYGNLPEVWENYSEEECRRFCEDAGFKIENIIHRTAFQGRDTSSVTGGDKRYLDFFVRKPS